MSSLTLPQISRDKLPDLFMEDPNTPRVLIGQSVSSLRQEIKEGGGSDFIDISSDQDSLAIAGSSLADKSAVISMTPTQLYAAMVIFKEEGSRNPKFSEVPDSTGLSFSQAAQIAGNLRLLESASQGVVLIDMSGDPNIHHVNQVLAVAVDKNEDFSLPQNLSYNFVFPGNESEAIPKVSAALRSRCQVFGISDAPRARLNSDAFTTPSNPSSGSVPAP